MSKFLPKMNLLHFFNSRFFTSHFSRLIAGNKNIAEFFLVLYQLITSALIKSRLGVVDLIGNCVLYTRRQTAMKWYGESMIIVMKEQNK